MTHFLSSVTQRRLDVRKVDMERTESQSLTCFPEHSHGQLRCVTAVGCSLKSLSRDQQCTIRQEDDSSTIVPSVWCAEQDGSISVRSSCGTGVLKVIPRKPRRVASAPHVFVFSLCTPRHDQVWAGMSDGFIQVFHSQTCEMMIEFHAHAAAITAFSVVSMPTNDREFEHHMNVVISASYDWTIAKWDTTTFRCLGKLMGHRVAIRSIGTSGNGEFLVSGGEDGSLRMWSLVHNEEVVGPPESTSNNDAEEDMESNDHYGGNGDKDENNNAGGGSVAWPILPAHDSAISGVCVIHDSYIASIGLDGVAFIWSLTGSCLHELERRNCGLSSIMHDVACARIWVGGIDGNIHFFSDDATLQWDPLGSAQDHSGCYVSAMIPIRQDHLQQMWLLDDEGNVTKFVETLSRDAITTSKAAGTVALDDEDPPLNDEELEERSLENVEGVPADEAVMLSDELDDLRQTAVQSYGELRQHRLRLAGAEAFQRSQRERIVLKFGDGMREAQTAVFRIERWLMRRKFMAVSLIRCDWMEKASRRAFLSICLWRWMMWSRGCALDTLKTNVASAVQSLTWNTLKAHAGRQLKLALHEKQRWAKLKNLVTLLETRGLNFLRHRYFSKWLSALVSQRKSVNHSHMSSARVRLFALTEVTRIERSDHHAFLTEHHQRRLHAIVDELAILSRAPIIRRFFESWKANIVKKRIDLRHEADEAIRHQRDIKLMTSYYWKLAKHRAQRAVVREQERRDDLDAEVVMWNELIREGSAINLATLKQEEDVELAKARRRADALEEAALRARELLDAMHEIKSDLVAAGLRLDPNLGLDGRVDAIFTYMKARGINTHKDVATISAAREDFVMLPLYVAPQPATTAASASASQRTATPVRRASVGTPRRGSAPTPARKASSPTKKKVEVPRSLLLEFEDELKRLRKHLTAAIRGADAAVLHAADQLLKIRNDNDLLADDDDWYISPESIKKCTRKELKESAQSLRRMICLYDCIKCKQDEAANAAVLYRSMVGAAATAKAPSIPVSVLRCVLCNTPTLIQLALHDFKLSSLEYVTVDVDDEADPTPAAATAVPKPTNSPRPKASALPIRRNSSPAASSVAARRNSSPAATTVPHRTSSPAQPVRGKLPAPRPLGPRLTAAPLATAAPAAVESAAVDMEAELSDTAAPATAPSPPRPSTVNSKAPSPKQPSPKASSPRGAVTLKPFLGLRVAIGPPQAPNSRVPSLVVAECNEAYSSFAADGSESTMEGPAFVAGLRVGDIITRFAGYAVTDLAAFNAIVGRHCRPGAVVPVQVINAESKESRLLSLTVKGK
ncbi:WD40 repeat-containing protein, putative [Bodo saltans]|uniref:WD40 repeat-containing protein, putative n=1 Tax=Bodo saltans TaxID=75058 RepID=A0A0S4INS7_BODSA|nr:WD40 repeat-containing protein, putative [Bodo saltans]|eukprot:CUF73254.1 WD40 repeat-containing protein, putative [Bodo saltans]